MSQPFQFGAKPFEKSLQNHDQLLMFPFETKAAEQGFSRSALAAELSAARFDCLQMNVDQWSD